ncbi:MAG: TonB-dependent receptor [Bacteroidales bacterium]|nr:MAG: TonB-dependent receptor [Bacteroidales bacterium]
MKSYICFKHWLRKKYSLLDRNKRIAKAFVLTATYIILMQSGITRAQTDTVRINKKIDLDEIEVIGQRSPALYSEISRIVTVITRDQIESAPVHSIQELLEYITGVDVRQRGMFGIQADINIRASSFDQVLILLNGINISDPHTGHFSMNLPLDAESVERIEILSGPAARVLGANAFAGAINIVTSAKETDNISLSASSGQYGFSKLNATGTMVTEKSNNFLSLSKSMSNGYTDFTDFDRYNLFYHGELQSDDANFNYQVGYDYKDFGANSFYSSKYREQYETTKTTFAAIKANTGNKVKITPSVYWRRLNDHYSMVIDTSYTFHAYNLTDIFGANLNFTIKTPIGKTALGFDYRTENIYSNNRGFEISDSIRMPGYKDIYLKRGYVRSNLEYFIEHNIYLKKFCFSAGAMLNWSSTFKNKIKLYPGIDLSYNLFEFLKIYGSINNTLRIPTFTDMFYEAPDTYGNIDLKPEKATTIESGLKATLPELRAQLSFYHRIGTDIIDWVWEQDTSPRRWHAENIADLSVSGMELSVFFNLNEIISPDFFIKHLHFNYSYSNITKSIGDYESKYALDNLKHKLTNITLIRIYRRLEASIYIIYQYREGKYDVYNPSTFEYTLKPYKSFWLVNAKLHWRRKRLTFFAEASNIFNVTYRDISNVIQPGRWITGGVRVYIDFPLKTKIQD